jgi:hypothetical protein
MPQFPPSGNKLLPRAARLALGLLLAALFSPLQISRAQGLTESCENPSFPGDSTAIDRKCGLEGSGGKEADQNAVKNNFCAGAPPNALTFTRLMELQSAVQQNSSINFGSHGPTTDRSPLQALGEGGLVQIQGYVVAAKQEGAESVNCGKKFDQLANKASYHDIHISLVETRELATPSDQQEEAADECKGIVVEMIPHHRPSSWTAANVNKVRSAHLPVRVTGQLFFDSSHVPCSGGAAVGSNPKRFSLWEIHPIYAFEVCTAGCEAEGTWVSLDQWLGQ